MPNPNNVLIELGTNQKPCTALVRRPPRPPRPPSHFQINWSRRAQRVAHLLATFFVFCSSRNLNPTSPTVGKCAMSSLPTSARRRRGHSSQKSQSSTPVRAPQPQTSSPLFFRSSPAVDEQERTPH